MRGGLEATVSRARISSQRQACPIPPRLVVKQLSTDGRREAEVYDALWRHLHRPPTARMLGVHEVQDRTYLYLEDVDSSSSWPWSDISVASLVCRELARFHDVATLPLEPFAWDYESELARSAVSTLEAAESARDSSGRRIWRRPGDLRRVVAALPGIRRRLREAPLTVIHGDMHPGNVIVRRTADEYEAVLIDWGRARLGSPLEDVASWLHSLRCWEPEARRRHDTLMRAYLQARREPRAFTRDVRADLSLASVSNGLSGAIRYHLAVLTDPESTDAARYDSGRALHEWQRIVRRGVAALSTNRDR